MDLQKQYDEVISWAKEKEVLLVKAKLSNGKAPLITFKYDDADSINAFESVVSKLDGKVIIYEGFLLTSEHYEEYLGYVKRMNDKEMIEDYHKLQPYQNKVLNYRFDFVNNGAIYRLENQLEELEIFHEIEEALFEEMKEANSNAMPKDEAHELGKQLANDENYGKAKNRSQKEFLAQKLFPQLTRYDGDPYRYVNAIAENIYEIEIKPMIEKQLLDHIQKLKTEGKSKTTICSELKISKDTLNKYY